MSEVNIGRTVDLGAVSAYALSIKNNPKHRLEQIQLVWCQVVEIATAGYLGL